MSKLIRRTAGKKQVGAALIVALQLTTLTLIGLMWPWGSGPQPVKAPAESQMSAPARAQTDQAQTVQPRTPAEKNALRKSAVFAKKLQEPLASHVFNLATSRAESAEAAKQSRQQSSQKSMQQAESPNEEPTLTTDREDYPPFSYVYISGTGFEPGETVNMIVVELDPVQQSFEPWDVVADENGNIETSWYIFSEEFIGATLQVTATGETSGLTASAIFTDARNWNLHFAGTGSGSVTIVPSVGTVNAPTSCGGTGTNAASQTVTSDCAPNITTSDSNAIITFTATASAGSTFGGWSATSGWDSTTCSGTTNPCNGVAGPNAAITVTFNGPTPTPTPTATATPVATATATPTATATATFTPTPTPTPSPAATNLTVAAASGTYGGTVTLSATLTSGGPVSGKTINFTLNGNPAGSGVTNASGVAISSPVTLCGASYNAGNYPTGAAASFVGDTDYAAASGSNSLNVAKADATVTVTPYTVTYDGNSHTATVASIVGVCGEMDATVGSVDVSNTAHTDAGTYSSDTWSFSGTGNYNNIGPTTITDTIDRADATINVTPYTTTYDCSAHTATGTATGVNSEDLSSLFNFSGTSHTDAGDYPSDGWTFNSGNTNPNYNSASGTVHDSIARADATISVSPYNVTYNCAAHTATGTATGVCSDDLSSSLNFTGTSHTDAGDYPSDSWTFSNPNYNPQSGTVHDSIARADATISVSPYSVTYNCSAHMATGTASGCDGDLSSLFNFSGTSHTNAGDYPSDSWTFNSGNANPNYNSASGTVHDNIARADATISVSPYSVTYNCAAHTATGTASGCDGDLSSLFNFSGTSHTHAGDYPSDGWTFNSGNANPNYNSASGTVHDSIARANATISVTPYDVTYNCNSHTATGTASGCDGDLSSLLNLTGTTHTNAADYPSDSWTFNSGNANPDYNSDSGTVHDQIDKAHATVNVTPYNVAYDAAAHTATGTATGCDGDLSSLLNLSGTTHTFPGDYPSDSWTFNSANTNTNYYSESGTVHDIIHYGTTCTGGDPSGVILPPINRDGSSVYKRKAGSTIPVKFKVCDAFGNSIGDPNLVFQTGCCGSITLVSAVRGTVDNVNEMGVNDIPDVAFRWTGDQWIFNMATTAVQAGYSYTFRINLLYGDIQFTIALK